MILKLNHKNLEAYKIARILVQECYSVTSVFPQQERHNLIQQIRRAALSVKLNLAEGSSRKSPRERFRYYEIARGSLIEIDAAIETASDLSYISESQIASLALLLNKCFALLCGMLK